MLFLIEYKLTGRPAHDGLAQVDYSGRRSGALQRGSGPIICEPGLEVCFDAAASSLAVRQWPTAALPQTGRLGRLSPGQSGPHIIIMAHHAAHVEFDSAAIGAPGMQDGAF